MTYDHTTTFNQIIIFQDVLDALKAYTERHYARLDRAAEERFVLLWTLEQMDEVGGGDEALLLNGHTLTNGGVELMVLDTLNMRREVQGGSSLVDD